MKIHEIQDNYDIEESMNEFNPLFLFVALSINIIYYNMILSRKKESENINRIKQECFVPKQMIDEKENRLSRRSVIENSALLSIGAFPLINPIIGGFTFTTPFSYINFGIKKNTFEIYRDHINGRFSIVIRNKSRQSLIIVEAARSYNPSTTFKNPIKLTSGQMIEETEKTIIKATQTSDSMIVIKSGRSETYGDLVRKSINQMQDIQYNLQNYPIPLDTCLPFPKLTKIVVEQLVQQFQNVSHIKGQAFNDSVVDIYEKNANRIAFMDVAYCAAGLNNLTKPETQDLKFLFKQSNVVQSLQCFAQITLSHNLAYKYGQNNARSGAIGSRFSLSIPSSVIEMKQPPNQLFLYNLIHKWFEEQIDFQFGFKALVTDFDPDYYLYQFVTNYCIDHKFYLEVLDPDIKNYLTRTVNKEDKQYRNYIKKKFKYQYFYEDFSKKY